MRSLSWLQLTSPSVVSSWGRLCVGRKQETRCVSWPYEVLSLHSTTYVEDQQPRTQPGGEKDLIPLCLCECGLPRAESFHFPTCCTPLPRSLPPSLQSPVCVVGVFLRHGHKRHCGWISFFFILISVHAHTDTQIEYLNQEDLLRLTESVGWCHFCFVSVTTVLNHANSCCSVFGLHRRLREIFQGFSPKAVAEKESLTVNHNPWAVSLDSIHLLDFTH